MAESRDTDLRFAAELRQFQFDQGDFISMRVPIEPSAGFPVNAE